MKVISMSKPVCKSCLSNIVIVLIIFLSSCSFGNIHFTESFTSPNFSTSIYYEGSFALSSGTWDAKNVMGLETVNAYNATGEAIKLNRFLEAYITTPAVNSAGSISFYYRNYSDLLGGGSFILQKSVDNGAFINVITMNFSNVSSYTLFSLDINEPGNNVRFRIYCPVSSNSGILCIDEVVVTDMGQTLAANPSTLNDINYYVGFGPSQSKYFNLFGSNLTGFPGDISATAPIDYEISLDNTTFSNTLNVPYTSSTLSATPVYVRLKTGLSIGTYNSELITIAGGGIASFNVVCNGNVTEKPLPAISLNTTSLTGCSYVFGSGPSSAQSFSMSVTNLNNYPGNILIAAPPGFQVSLDFSMYSDSLNIPYTNDVLATTLIYVRLKSGLPVNTYSDTVNISIEGTSASVLCSGAVTTPANPTLSVTQSAITGFTYINGQGPSSSHSYDLSGSNLTGFPGDIAVSAPSDYEISLDNITFGSGLNIPYTSSTLATTTIFVRLKSGLVLGAYNSQIISNTGGGAMVIDVMCFGNVTEPPTPLFSLSASALSNFTYIEGSGPSTAQSFNLSGVNLIDFPSDITVTAPMDYEVSIDYPTFAASVTITYTSETLSWIPVFVRLKSGLVVGTYNSESITISGAGAADAIVTCDGEVQAAPVPLLTISASSLSGFAYEVGSGPSAEQSYILSGSNLNGSDVTITPPANYEISLTTGSGFFSSPTMLNLPVFDGTSTTIYVRMIAGLAIGTYNSELVTVSGGGATGVIVTCNGEVIDIPTGGCATDLILSEYHEPAGGNNKGVEIYNGTGTPIDLAGYWIGTIANGGNDIEASIQLSGILNDKETACVYNDLDSDANFRLMGNINITWTNATWNGDDAVYLLKGGNVLANIIDAIGFFPPFTDPGTEFVDNGISTLNTAIVRKSEIKSPSPIWSGIEWDVFVAGEYTDWGVHTMNCTVVVSAPIISSIVIADGNYLIGDAVLVTLYADTNGYIENAISINGHGVTSFTDVGDNSYTMIYTVQEGHMDASVASDIEVSIVLENAGTTNTAFTDQATGNVTIDANRPQIISMNRNGTTEIIVSLSDLADNVSINQAGDNGFIVYEQGNMGNGLLVQSTASGSYDSLIILIVEDFASLETVGLSVEYIYPGSAGITDIAGNFMDTSIVFNINSWNGSSVSELLISEYFEGTGFNKAIEIYNATGQEVDLSHYALEKDVNGNNVFGDTYNYPGILANGSTFVISHTGADASLLALSDAADGNICNYNGNDQVRLMKDGIEIDRIGTPGGTDFAKDIVYTRKPFVCSPSPGEQDPATNGEWDAHAVSMIDSLGTHYSICTIVGIIDFDMNHFTIYPNPVCHTLFIDCIADKFNAQILSLEGRELFSEMFFNDAAISVTRYSAGIYLVRITNDKVTITEKIIIE